jgi:hypothetical protein
MVLHTETLSEPTTGHYCDICAEAWHEPYTHLSGHFWHVPASDGKYYLVRGTACGCPSFYFGRRPCKHIDHVRQLEVQGLKHDLPHVTWLYYERLRWPEDVTMDEIRGSID